MLTPPLRPVRALAFALALVFTALISAAEADSELKLAIIVSRHGVRAPLDIQQDYIKYSAQDWPKWNVAPGELTAHGRQQMERMGAYYRARYIQAGLLSGDATTDAPQIFFRANNLQRTIETARVLGTALLPGANPEIHFRPAAETDPLFLPAKAPVGRPDRARAVSAILGRVGGDFRAAESAHASAFAALERVLLGESGEIPAGKTRLLDLPTVIAPGPAENVVSLRSPLATAGSIVDTFMLAYAEGLPTADVAWGRLTPARLTELLELHSLWFELIHGTFYPAQVEASNLASHLGDTLIQAATGRALPGALGAPGQKMVVLAGHDTNQIALGGLLGLGWWLPGTQRNPVLLGGALVFELRERQRDHQFFVRAYYIAPTLEQTRSLEPLTLDHPPAIAPIFIPECSDATPGFDAPLAKFEALLRRVVDPEFVVPSAR